MYVNDLIKYNKISDKEIQTINEPYSNLLLHVIYSSAS